VAGAEAPEVEAHTRLPGVGHLAGPYDSPPGRGAASAPRPDGAPVLDDEPNDLTTPAVTAPPAKAVRRRRATKAAATPDDGPAVDAPAVDAQAPTGDGPVLEGAVSAAGETPGYRQDTPVEGTSAPADAATAPAPEPAKRARKAPAKKSAPRKRAAKAVAEAVTAVGTTDLNEADAAAAEELVTPAAPVVQAVEDDPAVAQSISEDAVPEALIQAAEPATPELATPEPATPELATPASGEADQPAGATRTRRRRAPAVVTFQAPEPEPVAPGEAPAVEEPAAPGESAAPRRRRRAGTTGALPASALLPTLLAPEQAPSTGAEDDDAEGPAEDAAAQVEDAAPEVEDDADRPRRRRRGRRGRGPRREDGEEITSEITGETEAAPAASEEPAATQAEEEDEDVELNADGTRRRRRRRRRSGSGGAETEETSDEVPTVVHVREPRAPRVRGASAADEDGVRGITGSTRMAAKRARRQEGRDSGRRRAPVLSEAEFLARREAVDRTMVVRQQGERTQIAVLEDDVLVEHYVTKASAQSYAGNVYLGTVQNVLPSMEAAFIDIGKGKNGVLYAGEVNYDAQLAGHGPRKIESVLKSGQDVLVQVSKDPIGHKGARLTSQISLPGRYLVYVPEGSMTGISRKLPDIERTRLKAILKKIVPDDAGVIIRTAAEGASEEELTADVRRLQAQWEVISTKVAQGGGPVLLHAEPDLVIRVVRDVFNEDFTSMVVQGDSEWDTISEYVEFVAPDLAPRLSRHAGDVDVFAAHRIDEQLAKALDRKVWLPSGGSLVIDRTEAMIVIDVNTGKYVGKGGNLEETVTRNNLEAAEEIARQLRLRDLGGIIVVDFIDMVLESNRDLVVRRLVECLGRDRTKHQIAEVTSLGLVQMTRKRVGQGLLESFSETCAACAGRGVLVHSVPVDGDERGRRDDRGTRDRKKAAAGPALVAAAMVGLPSPAPAAPVVVAGAEEGTAEREADTGREPGTGRGRRRRGGRGAGAATAAAAVEARQEARQQDADAAPDTAPLAPDVQGLADLAPDLVPELADQPPGAQEDQPVLPEGIGSVVDPAPVDVEQQPDPEAAPEVVDVEPVDVESVGAEPLEGDAEPGYDGSPAKGAVGDAEPADAEPSDAAFVGDEPADAGSLGSAEPTGAESTGSGPTGAQVVGAEPFFGQRQPEPEAAPESVGLEPVPAGPAAAAEPRRRRRATSRPAGPPTTA